jgi:rhodanese-related sulfurtransferase
MGAGFGPPGPSPSLPGAPRGVATASLTGLRLGTTAAGLAAILLAGVIAGCSSQQTVVPPLPTPELSTPSGPMSVEDAFTPGGPLFLPAQTAFDAAKEGVDILFLDARPALDYRFGHIPGAINVPYSEPQASVDELPRDRWLVTYCECPHAESEQLAVWLLDHGFEKVRVINEGLQGWRDAGGEVVSSEPSSGTQP